MTKLTRPQINALWQLHTSASTEHVRSSTWRALISRGYLTLSTVPDGFAYTINQAGRDAVEAAERNSA